MAQQSFLWTTLPNGYTKDGAGLRVSVMLSPRLDPQAQKPELSSFFPDWEDWPATLAKATFTISYGGTIVSIPAMQLAGAARVDDTLGVADSDVWRALFTADLLVRGFQFKDLSNNVVLSYDTRLMASLVRNLYAKLARNASGDMPLVSDIADDPDWRQLVSAVQENDRGSVDQDTGLRDPRRQFARLYDLQMPTEQANLADTLARFQLFHTPPATSRPVRRRPRRDDDRITASWVEYERPPMPAKGDLAKKLDFHQIVAAMNSYPTILRRLGLVIDFVLDRDSFPRAPDQLLAVAVTFEPGALQVPKTKDASPGTHTRLSADRFQAVSSPSLLTGDARVADGLLDLDPGRFDVLQVDIDSAGLKLMGFARSLARFRPSVVDDDGDPRLAPRTDSVTKFEHELGAPSLRTAGLMLVHRDRWAMLKNRFAGNKAKNEAAEKVFQNQAGANPPALWAEDVVRGYRIDVWDSTSKRWRSLCQRNAMYDLNDGAVVVTPDEPEEGTIRLGATKSADPASNQNLVYLHEALVAWTGWSLAAPPPGRAVQPDDSVDKTTAESEAELPPGLKFKSRFRAVPGSLPRLRFGRHYWMRARAVDLAGNSLPPQQEDFGPEKPEPKARPYLRYEPVAAPVIALVKPQGGATERPAEGESMSRMAIRSFNDTPALNTVPTAETARRFAVPAQASVRDAEQHGKLDAGGRVDSSTFNLLAHQNDLDAKDPAASLREETIPMQGPLDASPVDTVFAVYHDEHDLTYLPDPLAEEVAVRIFDHPNIRDSEIIVIALYPTGAWPNARPFKIEVSDHPTAKPGFVAATGTLRIPLPKAIRAKVRLSMRLSKDALATMGVFGWLSPSERAKGQDLALSGQHWMMTPWRTVEIVHAVQRPLIAPTIKQIVIERGPSATWAQPRIVATCSLKSTDRVDLLAEWHEPRDDAGIAESEAIQVDHARGDVAFPVKITDATSYARRRPGHPAGGIAEHTIEKGDDLIGINLRIERELVTPKFHEFHDTRYRRIEYALQATSKFREFLPATILTDAGVPTEKNIEITGPRSMTWIPSSAPPPAPDVLYIVPTFGWVRSQDDKGRRSSWRRGGGLRVYLDRPWNVSGYGEMLGVVLPPSSFKGNPDKEPKSAPYKKYITQWGNDPIWLSGFVSGIAPKRSNFPLARTKSDPSGQWLPKDAPPTEADQPPGDFTVTGLLPPDEPTTSASPVEVAPHDLFYDEERRLWCCDIEIDTGAAYYPFIRLALARYQPVSITGAHLSNVVLADFMPLTADRWLSITPTRSPKKQHLAVFGNRFTDSSSHLEAARAPSMSVIDPITHQARSLRPAQVATTTIIEVWVERLDEAEGEDFGWKRAGDAVVRPAARAARKPARVSARSRLRAQKALSERRFDVVLEQRLIDQLFVVPPIWEGSVTLPAGEGRYRIVIAEYEEYLVDDDRPYDKVPTEKDRRLVFVEHVELG